MRLTRLSALSPPFGGDGGSSPVAIPSIPTAFTSVVTEGTFDVDPLDSCVKED